MLTETGESSDCFFCCYLAGLDVDRTAQYTSTCQLLAQQCVLAHACGGEPPFTVLEAFVRYLM